ncbi:MAG TPA: hypothetical protein VK851_05405 [Anaerolineales bacterium]|nr:hypothetical protein [Anaerolineales bacterium]
MKTQLISFIILLVLIPAGCIQDQEPLEPAAPPAQEVLSTPLISQGDNTAELSTPLPDNVQILIETAKADLVQRLSLPPPEINLVTAIEVTWPDSSLGCPQPGVEYAQVLTEGFLINLEANGNIHEYHADTSGQIVSCEDPGVPIIPVTPDDIQDGIPWVPVN